MNAIASDNLREFWRWLICGAFVLAVHGSVATLLTHWSDPIGPAEPASVITIELAPVDAATTTQHSDLAIGLPQQQQSAPEPVEKVEPQPEPLVEQPPLPELAPTPPQVHVEIALPSARPPKPKPPAQAALATAPEAAARLAPRASNSMPAWKLLVSAHLQHHKRYPQNAQAHREQGTALLSFTINRQGHVIARSIVRSSGHPALDQEALSMVQRAQPFPPPPADIAGQQFPFQVPMRYYLR